MTPAVWTAVHALFSADTGSGGLANASSPIVTGMFIERAPVNQATPYIVFGVRSDTEADTKGKDQAVVRVAFNIYTTGTSGPTAQSAIVARLRTVFHRVQPTSISGFTFSKMQRVNGLMVPDEEEVFHMVEEYELHVFAT
jgi:hypothetical protein